MTRVFLKVLFFRKLPTFDPVQVYRQASSIFSMSLIVFFFVSQSNLKLPTKVDRVSKAGKNDFHHKYFIIAYRVRPFSSLAPNSLSQKRGQLKKRESSIILLDTTKVIFLFSSSLFFLLHTKNGFIFLSHGVKLNYRLSSPRQLSFRETNLKKGKKTS